MTRLAYQVLWVFLAGTWLLQEQSHAQVIESRYATITFEDSRQLKKFNNELYMGRLNNLIKGQKPETIEEEVAAKINAIVEKAMVVLDMYPPTLKFAIFIRSDEEGVQDDFRRIYNVNVDYIAFYSPHLNQVYYSADNGSLRVVVHEIGHVIVENYFKVSPPQRIHEVLAQYAEKHIND